MKSDELWKYLKSGELRFFWVFILLAGVLVGADFFYLSPTWALFHTTVLVVLGAVIFSNGYHLAKINFSRNVSSGRLESIISNLSDGIIAYDNNFKIMVFNSAAERIFKTKMSSVVGQRFGPERAAEQEFRLLTQTIFPSLAPSVVRHSEAGAYPQIIDISFPNQELRASTDRLLDEKGRVIGFVKLVEDRTREVELLRSKSEFITVAAHQLRTPLTAINWIFEGFAKSEAIPQDDRELSKNGLTATRKLLKIVNDLLDVSKIEEGRFGYNFVETNLVDFLSELLQNAEAVAKEYGVKLYFDRGGQQKLMVTIDPNRLGLAISNMLDNAIRYNVQNGSVTVAIKQLTDKPFVEISVADTGVGIPQEDINKLFTKFFRAENVMKRQTEGSGLGLFITRNIINRHGGTIWAESVIDRGTTFHFTIPTDSRLIPPKEVGSGSGI